MRGVRGILRLGRMLAEISPLVGAFLAFASMLQPAWSADSVLASQHVSPEGLLRQNFAPTAAGTLTIGRKILPPLDVGIFVNGNPACASDGERVFMATTSGIQPLVCNFGYVAVSHAKYVRMSRDADEYVCIRNVAVACHRVVSQNSKN